MSVSDAKLCTIYSMWRRECLKLFRRTIELNIASNFLIILMLLRAIVKLQRPTNSLSSFLLQRMSEWQIDKIKLRFAMLFDIIDLECNFEIISG